MGLTIGPSTWHPNFPSNAVLGTAGNGGVIICKASNVAWIVSPLSTQITRVWNARNDAVTVAQAATGCNDWFVPTPSQMTNPGYCCRAFWDCYCTNTEYWTANSGVVFRMSDGVSYSQPIDQGKYVRAFRCFTY